MLKHRFFIFLLGSVFLACFYGCKDPDLPYKVIGFNTFNADNTRFFLANASDTVAAKSYAIRLEYLLQIDLSSPDINEYDINCHLSNRITAFNIYSLTAFDAARPAHSSLNDYFLYADRSGTYNGKNTIPNMLNNHSMAACPSLSGPDHKHPFLSSDYLVLMFPPDSLGKRDFVIDLQFADHTQMTDTVTVNLY